MPDRIAIAVLTGGYSGEAPISLKSAAMVMQHIDPERFEATLIHIDPNGWWYNNNGEKKTIDIAFLKESRHQFAGAFIMVHGTPGEDGKLQAELEAHGIPHTTGDSDSVALTFHKANTNAVLRKQGIHVADSAVIKPNQIWDSETLISELGLPCFVKPNEAGSSLGISRVEKESQLNTAILSALEIGPAGALVERMLQGREFSVGIIPDESGDPEALPVTEIRTDRAFFDYQAKYSGESEEITPAHLSATDHLKLKQMALAVYRATQCAGLARVDLMLVPGETPFVIEVNAVPGFSSESIIPKQCIAHGLTVTEFISRIIDCTILLDASPK
jgi:D-alanine-D-alanine ligase